MHSTNISLEQRLKTIQQRVLQVAQRVGRDEGDIQLLAATKTRSATEINRALEAGAVNGVGKEETRVLMEDEEARRLLWYAAFLKPLRDRSTLNEKGIDLEMRNKPRKDNRSIVVEILVDGLKRPIREAESVEKIMKAADGFTMLVSTGSDVSALPVLLSGARVLYSKSTQGEIHSKTICIMDHKAIDSDREDDPVWEHCMEFRQNCADILRKIEPLWRAAFVLSLCEQLMTSKNHEIEYMCGGDMVSCHASPDFAYR